MSDMNNNGKEAGSVSEEQNLIADELAASLCREISGDESLEAFDQNDREEENTVSIENELFKALSVEEKTIDDSEDLIRELQLAVDGELASFAEKEEEPIEEVIEEETAPEESVEEVIEEETAPEESVEEVIEEETAPEESVEEVIEEETAPEESVEESIEEETASVEEISEKPVEEQVALAEESLEEAFDTEDTGVLDVSQGVRALSDAPTEEIPNIPLSIPAVTDRDLRKEEEARQKEDKKRLKQEAAEAKAREKQEAKERKRQEKEEKKANKKKGPLKIILLVLLILIASAAIVYLALSNRYKTVFFDGTKINGADCTGLTVEEAETVIARQMDEYDLTLIFRDGKQEVISGDSIGFEYVPDGSVQEIKDSQIPIMWVSAFFDEYSYEATAACSFDTVKLSETITALEECNLVNMQAPQDAYVKYNEEKREFEIVPEEKGNKFNLSSLIEAAQEAIPQGIREINVEDLGIYENPVKTTEDPELNEQINDMNQVISASVTYNLPTGEDKVLDATTLVTWLSHDEAGNYYVDAENWGAHVANYVDELAQIVNTSDSKADFKTQNGATVSLDNYLQGWLIDQEEEGAQLTQELSEHQTVSREPIYAQRAYSNENNGIGNTYVEVDLSAQYLWCVDNGQVVIESPVVSGMMVSSRYTPDGIYALYGKQAGRWLRGYNADGSLNYESWVDYWMPFNGGIGLHDASWRAEFGGSTYIGGGSHGCVNLPVGKAAAIFDWITAGTPVICYYSGGCSVSADGTYGED